MGKEYICECCLVAGLPHVFVGNEEAVMHLIDRHPYKASNLIFKMASDVDGFSYYVDDALSDQQRPKS